MVKKLLTIVTIYASLSASFDNTWHNMQDLYNKISIPNSIYHDASTYSHPVWNAFTDDIKNMISGKPNPNFLRHPSIACPMIRGVIDIGQLFEICFLQQCISKRTKTLLSHYTENNIGNLPKICHEFNCSANALGQLYYAARVLETTRDKDHKTIIEFGGGFGTLADIFKQILPDVTYVIIDLPELIAIQYLYLASSFDPKKIVVALPGEPFLLQEGALHLIPSYMLNDIEITADIFISNFALSETPLSMQHIIVEKRFFDAPLCYVTGQLNGWGTGFNFAPHNYIHEALRATYTNLVCQPFHFFLHDQQSYEIIAHQTDNGTLA
jgi:hypothetical protein